MTFSSDNLTPGMIAAMRRPPASIIGPGKSKGFPAHTESNGGEPVDCEQDLHEQIRKECAGRGWLAFHGSMAHRTFRTQGEPDWVILAGQGRTILCECKASKGKLSTEQVGIALWASKLGHTVYVVRSIADFIAVVGDQSQAPRSD